MLTNDKDSDITCEDWITLGIAINVRPNVVSVMGISFSQVPDKTQAWQDIMSLTCDMDIEVRRKLQMR